MLGLTTLAAGAIDIQGGQVEIADQISASDGDSASVALVDATTTNVSVNISGVTASAKLDKSDNKVVEGIAIYNVSGAVIRDNDITLTGSASSAEDILVKPDQLNPLPANGAVIDGNIVNNFDISGGGLIVVGENRSPGGDAYDAQIDGNVGSGDAASQAAGLHGILIGFQTGAVVSGNVITSAFLAYGMKDDFGTNLVEDNVDYDSSRYSLYQKGGSGVEWLNNSSCQSAGFDPFGLTVGPDTDEPGQIYYVSGGEADGNLIVYSGASGRAALILPGDSFAAIGAGMSGVADEGTLAVSSGGVVTSAIIYSGGVEQVLSGGSAAGVEIESGGTLSMVSGGAATGVTVVAGGSIYGPVVLSAAAVDEAVYSGVIVEAALTVASGGVAVGLTVEAGGSLTVEAGGALTLSGGVVSKGVTSLAHVIGAPTSIGGGALSSGAILDLLDETVSSGGLVKVDADAAASGTKVLRGGELVVYSGGAASGTAVLGSEKVLGSESAATVSSGGEFVVYAGADAAGTTVLAGGIERLLGAESAAMVSRGGVLAVSSGGVASATTVMSGGIDKVLADGTDRAAVVSGGGAFVVYGGAVASGTDVLNGGRGYVLSAGVASGAVLSGGREVISAGGSAVDATVADGGVLYALKSAKTAGTVVSAGGYELVSSGAVARGATVLSGGRDYVYSGAQAIGATVSDGGDEIVSAGGVASGLTLLSGALVVDEGEVRISGAGTLDGRLEGSGSIVETGRGDLVIGGAGASFTGRTAVEGGVIELATSGALGTGEVLFASPTTGSAVLQIDAADAPRAGGTFANTLVNFGAAGEELDLAGIAYVAGASATHVGATLVLSDGGETYTFKLADSTVGDYSVTSDGHGGTLIDPIVAQFAQAAAAFAPSDAAKTALVSSTSPTAQTPFAHAAVSASAGHL